MTPPAAPELTDRQFDELRRIIRARAGLWLGDDRRPGLGARLAERLADLDLDDFDQYLALLTTGPYQAEEFQEMFDRINSGQSTFFQGESQLEVFERWALPGLIERRRAVKRLRLWSAACATGEDAYTLAILVQRSLGVRLMDWQVEIMGTDFSERALSTATQGRYSDRAVAGAPAAVRGRYFTQDGPCWVLQPGIRAMVNFEPHRLKDRLAARRRGVWDAIFCRGAMATLDEALRRDVLAMFADQLADDGYLFIGPSESLAATEGPFEPLPAPQGMCYRKTAVPLDPNVMTEPR